MDIKIKRVNREEKWTDKVYLFAIYKGLKLTVKHFIRNLTGIGKKTVTINYPEEKRPISPRWRGRHVLTRNSNGFIKCVACFMCETVCPANCIYIESAEHPDKSIEKYPRVFDIDELRCIFCGLCVEACPKDAIRMDTGVVAMAYSSRNQFNFTRSLLTAEEKSDSQYKKYSTIPLPSSENEALYNSVGKLPKNSTL